jgi:HK97 family phage prohead protease
MTVQKTFRTEAKVLDETEGIVTAFVNTMGRIDKDGDIIEATAFNESIENNLPIPVLSGHDQSQIVGKVVSAYPMAIDEDEYRLHATMQFNMKTESGRDAFSNVSGNYVREWSVGFNLPEGSVSVERNGNEIVRRINSLDWVETSSVVRGASPETGTLSAKSEELPEQPITQDAASDTVEETASDTELAKAKLLLIKTQLEMKDA